MSMEKKRKTLLVVTRKTHEAVRITTPSGDTLEVGVIQIRGRQVRIGFKCSEDFKIVRTDGISEKCE